MKKLSIFTIASNLIASTHCLAQKTKEDVVERITGSWKFKHYYMPYDLVSLRASKKIPANTSPPIHSTRTVLLIIQSTDNSWCKVNYPPLYWSVVSLHDVRGKLIFCYSLNRR